MTPYGAAQVATLAATSLAGMILIDIGSILSQRYLLSRTKWRGIPFRLDGPLWPLLRLSIRWNLATVATLFVLAPVATARIAEARIGMTSIGNRNLSCRIPARSLYRAWIPSLAGLGLLAIWALPLMSGLTSADMPEPDEISQKLRSENGALPLVGLALLWIGQYAFKAAVIRAAAKGTSLGSIRLESRVRGITLGGFATIGFGAITVIYSMLFATAIGVVQGLQVGVPIAIILFALALAIGLMAQTAIRLAWIVPWTVDHVVSTLRISGDESLDSILAAPHATSAVGDGLSDVIGAAVG